MAWFTCDYCGASFKEAPTNRPHPLKFCTMACQSAWQRESKVNTGSNNPRWNGGPPPPKIRRDYKGSNSPSWKGISAERPCDECGNLFRPRSESKARRQKRAHWFCSIACKAQWQSKNLVGERANRWTGGKAEYYGPDWKQQSRAARKRDDYQCQHCGTSKGQSHKALDVHHIRPFRDFGYIAGVNDNHIAANHLDNLITLCPACHKAAEVNSSSSRSSSMSSVRSRSASACN